MKESNARKKVDNIEAISKKKLKNETTVLVASAKETTKGVVGADKSPELDDGDKSDTANIPSSRKNKELKEGLKRLI